MAGNRKMARAVGNALHKNPDPDRIPCHRVVNSRGELAEKYAIGGTLKQIPHHLQMVGHLVVLYKLINPLKRSLYQSILPG